MAIFKKGNTWYIDYYVDGKRKREAIGPRLKTAELILDKRKVQIAEGRFLDIKKQSNITFDQLSKLYLEYGKTNKKSWIRDEFSIARMSEKFAGNKIRQMSSLSMEQYKADRLKQVKPATLNRELNCLKHMFTKAVQWELISINPTLSIKLVRVENKRLRFLSKEECKRLYHAASDDLRPILVFALHTGMRRGEILNLKWEDVSFEQKLLYIRETKSGEPREIPISETVFKTLSKIKDRGIYVFPSRSGERRKDLRTAFSKALKRAKIKEIRFHDLRHTFASHLVMSGVDLLTVKELLGHKSIDMTLRYAHLSPSHKRNAIESLKIFDGHFLDTFNVSVKATDNLSDCRTIDAEVVKLVDALRSGRSVRKDMGVRVPPSAFESL